MKTISIDLTVDKIKTKLNFKFLKGIVDFIPDTKENTKVFRKLATSNNYMVRKSIAQKRNIDKKTAKILSDDQYSDVVTTLLENAQAIKKLSCKQIKKIIKTGNPIHCEKIILQSNLFEKCNIYKLFKILSQHTDPSIRLTLAKNWRRNIHKDILKILKKDKDFDVANAAKISLIH